MPRLEIEYTTVPAPGSIALLALAGIVLRRRRR
ncbi:MAG: PEP-CTERM sorting domain-containing protein [Phycisphaerales bacterium]